MKRITVLSLEQALSLPHGTARLVHEGARVIRLESTPRGGERPGDPNRYVGRQVDDPDRCAYFYGPNAGKESIALDLSTERGRALLLDLIRALPVDVFAVNTLPRRYAPLGVDYERLTAVNPRLIWVGVSAYGPAHPDVPGYDPVLQAELGYMDMTGEVEGPPILSGVPMIDLKAGDEVFAQVCLALAELAESGAGKRIDVSMAQAAASWLVTQMPLLSLQGDGAPLCRNGNEHREFVPVNVYPCRDGHVFLAIGNDTQWQRLVALEGFGALDLPARRTNAGRAAERQAIHREIAALTRKHAEQPLITAMRAAGLVAAAVNPLSRILEHPAVDGHLLSTDTGQGRPVHLAPPAVDTAHLTGLGRRLAPPPRYAEHTRTVLAEAGLSPAALEELLQSGVAWQATG